MSDFKRSKTIEKRFWKYVDKRGDDDCWEWTGFKLGSYYGGMNIGYTKLEDGTFKNKMALAHRISYEIHFGAIPDGLHVCHHCDNPICVNPNHLFVGTIRDNIADRERKGRGARGSKNGRSKLTESQVVELRKRYANGESQKSLATAFGVTITTINHIVTGKTWRLVNPTDVTQPVTVRTSRLKRVSGKAA